MGVNIFYILHRNSSRLSSFFLPEFFLFLFCFCFLNVSNSYFRTPKTKMHNSNFRFVLVTKITPSQCTV